MNLKILPYKMGSKSAKELASHFNVKRIFANGRYTPKGNDVILNWGCNNATILSNNNATILNTTEAVRNASDKVATLTILRDKDVPCVDFVLSMAEAIRKVREGSIMYCRTLTRASEGAGIVVAEKEEELVPARLYTSYFKNRYEYRIHVFNGEIIDRTQKRRMTTERLTAMELSDEDRSSKVRNLKKGWTFTRQEMTLPEGIDQLAINAVNALGLTFGAVDIGWNQRYNQLRVFEINTAAGMDSGTTTHMRYIGAISKYLSIPFVKDEYCSKYNCELTNNLL